MNERPNDLLLKKYEELKNYLRSMESVAVSFYSGVDSTFLLYAAKQALNDNITQCGFENLHIEKIVVWTLQDREKPYFEE